MSRRTKIVATVGPSCTDREVLEEMFTAGVDVVRLNLSHGRLEEHLERLRSVREAAESAGRQVAVLADLPGPGDRPGGRGRSSSRGSAPLLSGLEAVDGSQAAGAHLRSLPREGDSEGTEEDAQLAEDYERAKADEKAAKEAKRAASNALYARHREGKRVILPNGGRVSLGARGIRVTGLEEV